MVPRETGNSKILKGQRVFLILANWQSNCQTVLNWPDLVFYCLTPDDFTRQWGTPGSQWVKHLYCTSMSATFMYFLLRSSNLLTDKCNHKGFYF